MQHQHHDDCSIDEKWALISSYSSLSLRSLSPATPWCVDCRVGGDGPLVDERLERDEESALALRQHPVPRVKGVGADLDVQLGRAQHRADGRRLRRSRAGGPHGDPARRGARVREVIVNMQSEWDLPASCMRKVVAFSLTTCPALPNDELRRRRRRPSLKFQCKRQRRSCPWRCSCSGISKDGIQSLREPDDREKAN